MLIAGQQVEVSCTDTELNHHAGMLPSAFILSWDDCTDVETLSQLFEFESVKVFRVLVETLGDLCRSNIQRTLL